VSQHAINLVPNDFEFRAKAHSMGEREWNLGVKLVDRTGFRPNVVGGLAKTDVGLFARHLARALEQESLSDADRRALDGLLVFLTGGAADRGLAIKRGWKRWNAV
jgi:hypothetical protein